MKSLPERRTSLIRRVTYHGPVATFVGNVLFGNRSFKAGIAFVGLDSPPRPVYTRGKVILLPQLGNR
jgi:hypothetical protein